MTYTEQKTADILLAEAAVDDVDLRRQPAGCYDRSVPRVLSLPFGIAFTILLVSLCTCIALLWHFSSVSDGFDISNANHYVLAYGPTAILVWVVAAWRQVDYHAKASAPWEQLCSGPSKASKSLLLDYVSTFQAAALWSAFGNKHFRVVFATLGFGFLKVATLASTGLFVLQPSVMRSDIKATFNSTLIAKSFNVNNNSSIFDQSLLYTTYGILVQDLQKPLGLGAGLAYPTFSVPPTMPQGSNVTVVAEAFVPSFQCRAADIDASLGPANSTEPNPDLIYTIASPACSRFASSPSLYTLNPQTFLCPERQLSGLVQNINCDRSVFGADDGVYSLLLLADMRYSQELNSSKGDAELSDPIEALSWSSELAKMTGVVCRLSYSMENVTLSASMLHLAESINIRTPDNFSMLKLDTFSDTDLDSLFRGAWSASDGILGDRGDSGYAFEYPDPTFKMMAAVVDGSYETLLNATTMAEAASLVSTQLAAQIAHQYLRENSSDTALMVADQTVVRLKVATVPAWVIIAMLASVAVVKVGLIASQSRVSNHHHRESPDIVVPLLRATVPLTADLLSSQTYKEEQLVKALSDVQAYLLHDGDSVAEVLLDKSPEQPSELNKAQPWWHPITVGKLVLALTFFMTLALIITLEMLQRLSDAKQGFIELAATQSEVDQIFTHFVPALIMLMLASLYNCFDFNVLLLAPYHKMRLSLSIDELKARPLVGQPPPQALWSSVKRHLWAPTASTCAAMVGTLLTIVVSGLYSVGTIDRASSVPIEVVSEFMPVWSNSAINDNGSSLISSLTENLQFPYPAGTFSELAYPTLRLDNLSSMSKNSSFSATVPSWRADLQCTTLPGTNFSLATFQSRIQNSATINTTFGLPSECAFGGENGTLSVIEFVQTFVFANSDTTSYVGKLLDLHVGPYDTIQGSSQGERDPSAMVDNPLGCPSLAFIYGYIDLNAPDPDTSNSNTISVDVCYQRIQNIQATFTFLDQNFTLDTTSTPRLDETSTKFASFADSATLFVEDPAFATAFQFRVQNHFDQAFAIFNSTNNNPYSTAHSISSMAVDPFFQGALFGRTPIPLTTLQLQGQTQRDQAQQAILRMYRRYMAQAVSLNMRTVPTTKAESVTGKSPQALAVRRVFQHNTSKLILQGMLAFMLVCGIITTCTIQMHELLPSCANPCTIWGQMSLWAGSSLCNQECTDAHGLSRLHQAGAKGFMGGGYLNDNESRYRLGWWTSSGGGKRYGIDMVDDL